MTKSIHFAQIPNMHGKRTMRYTDVVIEDLRPRSRARVAEREMRFYEDDTWEPWEGPDTDGLYDDAMPCPRGN